MEVTVGGGGPQPCPLPGGQLTFGQGTGGSWVTRKSIPGHVLREFRVGMCLAFQSHGNGVDWVHLQTCTLASACLLPSSPWAAPAGSKALQAWLGQWAYP